jgi:hypothetical protein
MRNCGLATPIHQIDSFAAERELEPQKKAVSSRSNEREPSFRTPCLRELADWPNLAPELCPYEAGHSSLVLLLGRILGASAEGTVGQYCVLYFSAQPQSDSEGSPR